MSGLRLIGLGVVMAGALALGGCQTTLLDELNAAGERIDRSVGAPALALRDALAYAGEALKGPDLSPAAQQAYGDQLAGEAFRRLPMASDRTLEGHLTGMANRIAEQARGVHFTYRVYLVDAGEPNAFTPGAGHIFVTTGLVARLGNEAQMAMVLAHEIAHSTSGHVIKTDQRRQISQKAAAAGKTVFSDKLGVAWIGDGLGMAANAAVNLYTRDQEDQADEAGLDYMIAAGYDLREAEKAIKSLIGDGADEDGSFGGAVFGDHSSKARRMQRLRNLIVARYGRQDYSRAVRTTLAYERASLSYR